MSSEIIPKLIYTTSLMGDVSMEYQGQDEESLMTEWTNQLNLCRWWSKLVPSYSTWHHSGKFSYQKRSQGNLNVTGTFLLSIHKQVLKSSPMTVTLGNMGNWFISETCWGSQMMEKTNCWGFTEQNLESDKWNYASRVAKFVTKLSLEMPGVLGQKWASLLPIPIKFR